MDEKVIPLLRKIVEELTDCGQDMGGLRHTREEVVYWLKDRKRPEDAAAIEGGEDFQLTGTEDGLVYVWTGPGFTDKQTIHDMDTR